MRDRFDAVLFDLDGTLADSAPDLAGAANDLRARHGLEPLAFERLRPMVGSGARGMVGTAFGLAPGDEGYEALRDAFLALYESRLLARTVVFPRMPVVLAELERLALRWGIVTNKAMRFTAPLVAGLDLGSPPHVVIGGDTTPFAKPHPEPLLEAARRLGVAAERCVYVGDDRRDVQAGRAAGMATLVAAWGYLGTGEPVETWGADAVIAEPEGLLNWLELP